MNVFITKSGEKYHLYTSCLKRYEYKIIKEEEAIKLGKQLCKNCEIRRSEKKFYPKKNNYKYNKNNNQNFINSNDPDDVIYNDPLMKNQLSIFEDNKLQINNNINNINNISNSISIDFNNQNNSSKYLDKNEIESDNTDSEEEEKIATTSKKNKNYIINKNNNNNFVDITECKGNNIAERIQANIEKDKYLKQKIFKKIEMNNEKEINENEYNFIEDSKDDDSVHSQGIQSYKSLVNSKVRLCGAGDMDILEETDNSALQIHFQKQLKSYNNKEFQNKLQLGRYKFTFEIKDLKDNEIVEIEVGFKIVYKNSLDINFQEKNNIKDHCKKFKVGTLYDTSIITKQLIFGENTNKIYAFINVKKGKFFIIGKTELERRRQNIFLNKKNTEIFYIKNCGNIFYVEITKAEPIFNFDESIFHKCRVIFNGQEISPKI